ncbi:MAG: penicillin-insensitive murein endopeptidase [Myxococcota bacterium]|jgi:penicillin-insensitive murein endopeptidase
MPSMRLPLLFSTLTGLLLATPVAAESVGFYKGGSQHSAVAVPSEGPDHYLLFPPKCYVSGPDAYAYPSPGRRDNFYGHLSVVQAIEDAAVATRKRFPDAPRVPVGEVSNPVGGEIPFHLSHQNGLDVDLWFLQRPVPGAPARFPVPRCSRPKRFVEQDPTARKWQVTPGFEPGWNWALAEALAANDQVTLIFVSPIIEKALAEWARANKVPTRVRSRTLRKLYPVFCRTPKGIQMGTYKNNRCPHDDHFHVRFRCPKDSPKCLNRKPH